MKIYQKLLIFGQSGDLGFNNLEAGLIRNKSNPNFDVLLTVHLSMILVITNLMHKIFL